LNMKRPLRKVLSVTIVLAALYIVGFVWPAGGVRRQFGRLSGTRLPEDAKGVTRDQILALTHERAESIRIAILAYQRDVGSLPPTLEALVPAHLSRIPEPLTSSMPFRLMLPPSGGFAIRWEAWPNAAYECCWIDQDGKMAVDM
jgi:hypothetical protein